jgi:hypothetical protein
MSTGLWSPKLAKAIPSKRLACRYLVCGIEVVMGGEIQFTT